MLKFVVFMKKLDKNHKEILKTQCLEDGPYYSKLGPPLFRRWPTICFEDGPTWGNPFIEIKPQFKSI